MYPKIEIAKQFSINKINGGNSCLPVIFLGGNRLCQRIIVIFFGSILEEIYDIHHRSTLERASTSECFGNTTLLCVMWIVG